jgi:hypothetical protein
MPGVFRMKLLVTPPPTLSLFSMDLQLLILIEEDRAPELILDNQMPRPDRHLLLGLVQGMAMAVEERDPESVAFIKGGSVRLLRDGNSKELRPGLLLARSTEGAIGVLATVDYGEARRLARKAVRWFTGTIRLDLP